MRVLGIETATELASVALVEDGEVLAEVLLPLRRKLTEELVPVIDWTLKRAGVKLGELDGVAVSIGPGSFTGLRVGMSTAKGLCFACGLPLVGVPTLKAMASRLALSQLPICPLLDARRNQIYSALYKFEGGSLKELSPPRATSLEELLSSLERPVVFTGDAVGKFRRKIEELKCGATFAPPELSRPAASSVAALGSVALAEGETSDLSSLEPIYIRSPVCRRS
ncbi:MAG: tRNA (adenosine(37)-N6)-threonylcarbamoyltransferase complex dimerization subunit type 1 TsaB [Candidatus Latescibacterota bacterium]|nr:MAG: tRNA (adenosine(37)-N6)-threonylcarbamoyltransferase complex dimerization subunit type 1 TsaB [Candidatus Latescibacterota bacterium]